MKRSTRVSLVLVASVSAAAMLSGCEAAPDQIADNGGTFTNMAECVAVYDQQTCQAAQQLANKEHVENAPKFNNQAACAAEYGADMCRPASAYGGSSNQFVPLMLGYMLGSANSTPAPLMYGNRYERDRYRGGGYPIYTSGRGYNRGTPVGSYQAPASNISTKGALKGSTAMTPPSTIRGGFGSSFKPTNSFKSNYAATNPSSFGRTNLSTSSARYVTAARTTSVSRGGFGSSGRSFGGGFGG
jgi:uncharacterized protein YgiB involved in biofilm formation